MFLNEFSVRIPDGHETSGGYVELRHGQTYRLRLRNSRGVRCDARVEIDGKHIGTWRIPAHESIVLERPEHDDGRFTFYKLGTADAEAAQLDRNDPNLGLVKVTFMPEREGRLWWWGQSTYEPYLRWVPRPDPLCPPSYPRYDWAEYSTTSAGGRRGIKSLQPSAFAMPSASAGGTGLSGESDQRFGNASRIEYDYSQQTTIHLRLVCKNEQREGPRPLTSTSNPIPPRIW